VSSSATPFGLSAHASIETVPAGKLTPVAKVNFSHFI